MSSHNDGSQNEMSGSDYSPVNFESRNSRSGEMWLSLNKSDLVNVEGNKFTFCWNKKIIPDFSGNFQAELKYITLPRNYSYLLAKYGDGLSSDKRSHINRVFSASGKNYSAKLIPCHTSEEHTTYQALGSFQIQANQLPATLTFTIITPSNSFELNIIPVQRVVKTERLIEVITKGKHNLCDGDVLTLEFPKQHICYRIANLEILSDNQIRFSSPFSGYFSSDFRLLKNYWNLDLTLFCRYNRKN